MNKRDKQIKCVGDKRWCGCLNCTNPQEWLDSIVEENTKLFTDANIPLVFRGTGSNKLPFTVIQTAWQRAVSAFNRKDD